MSSPATVVDQASPPTEPLTVGAFRLGVSYVQAQRLMLRGDLRGQRVGGRWFVVSADVDRVARERAKSA